MEICRIVCILFITLKICNRRVKQAKYIRAAYKVTGFLYKIMRNLQQYEE